MGAQGARFWKKRRRVKRRPKRQAKRRMGLSRRIGFYSGMPRQKVVKLRYSQYGNITNPGTGALVYQKFRANGIFDPDLTGVGHQPMGYDQMKAQYQHYVVLGSKISVKVIPQQNTTNFTAALGLYISDDTSLPYTDYTGFIESNKGTYRLMNGATTRAQTVVTKYSAKTFFGVTDVKDNVDRFGSAVLSDPSEQAIFNLWYQGMDGGTGPTSVTYLATIDYIVAFSEPQDMVQS